MKVCDADTHVLEPMDMWQEYVEPKYRAAAPRLILDDNKVERMVIGDKVMNPGPFSLGGIGVPGGMSDPVVARSTPCGKASSGGWDAARRVKDMDAEGVDRTVIYTSIGLFFGGNEDPPLMGALCRAYNNWIADFCKQAPDRFFAMAIVPLMDIETSILEARRAIEELGRHGIMLRQNPCAARMLQDPAYAPFWSEVQRLGVPVGFHDAAVGNIPFVGNDRCKSNQGAIDPAGLGFAFTHIVCHPFE